jgi:hypothetical protein
MPEGFQPDGEVVHGCSLWVDEGTPPERSKRDRYCQECGTKVCSYKDPLLDEVWCYAHEHLAPWTRPYLLGLTHVDRSNVAGQQMGYKNRGIMREVEGAA